MRGWGGLEHLMMENCSTVWEKRAVRALLKRQDFNTTNTTCCPAARSAVEQTGEGVTLGSPANSAKVAVTGGLCSDRFTDPREGKGVEIQNGMRGNSP
jgi:hypothetical protein